MHENRGLLHNMGNAILKYPFDDLRYIYSERKITQKAVTFTSLPTAAAKKAIPKFNHYRLISFSFCEIEHTGYP